MRVLILANMDIGLYKFRKELIEALLQERHEVFIALPGGDMIRPFQEMGCVFLDTPIDRRGVNPVTDAGLFQRYRKMMREVDPDLVVTYTIKPNIYGGTAARLAHKPYAVNITGLGTVFEKAGTIRSLVICLYRFALKKAKIVFFENSSNRDTLLSFRCCRPEQTFVLQGAGVNTDTYGCQPYPHNDKVRFLFIGRVMREKGIDELFVSMRRLVREGVPCFLDVVGPFEEDYKNQLRQCESEGWLQYHGFQEDVRPFVRHCDCFVLPSYHEGMANTNLECASSGRPIITSDIPGCREAVIEGVSGLLCAPKNAESLYEAMHRMILTPEAERARMGQAGRQHMQDRFDKRKVVEETIRHLF